MGDLAVAVDGRLRAACSGVGEASIGLWPRHRLRAKCQPIGGEFSSWHRPNASNLRPGGFGGSSGSLAASTGE